jgi:hypothetical protein
LLITEIMYHPPSGATNFTSDDFEFIELKSVAPTNLELSGLCFTNGINYTFPVGTFLAPRHFIVLVSNPAAFTNRYPAVHVDGIYTGKLSNTGENVSLMHATGAPIFSVNYGTQAPWPASPDGAGFSLVPINPNLNTNPDNPINWRASSVIGGSPGADDAVPNIPRVLVSEALTHTDLPQLDSIELYNPFPTNVDIGDWYLTDQRTVPKKFRIPPTTTIPANGYKVFTELDWDTDPLSSNSFRLNSHGEEIYLYSGDTNGNLTGYSDGFAFGAAQNGVSFGRYVISTGEASIRSTGQYPEPNECWATCRAAGHQRDQLSSPNRGRRIHRIEEHHQWRAAPVQHSYPTNTWRLNGVGFDFPTNIQVAPHGWCY